MDRIIDVNIRGVLYGIAAVLPVMNKQGHGQIITCVHRRPARHRQRGGPRDQFAARAIFDWLRQENDKIRVTWSAPRLESQFADSISDEPSARGDAGLPRDRAQARGHRRRDPPRDLAPEDVDTTDTVVRRSPSNQVPTRNTGPTRACP